MSSEGSQDNVDRSRFEEAVEHHFRTHPTTAEKKKWTREKLTETVRIMREYLIADKTIVKRETIHYSKARSYDLYKKSDGTEVLIERRHQATDPYVEIICVDDWYDILLENHLHLGHAGRDNLKAYMSHKNNIPIWAIATFVKLCPHCERNKNIVKRGLVVKPILADCFQKRGQIDLLDFQQEPDGDFHWVFHYQDHMTKWCFLAPLKRKTANEVAACLQDVFWNIGAPLILQSDNGREFRNRVMHKLIAQWPKCQYIHSRPRHPQSQGSIERANKEIKKLVKAWKAQNNTEHWAEGLKEIQWIKNNLKHRIIGRSPYEAVYGGKPLCERGVEVDLDEDELYEDIDGDLEECFEDQHSSDDTRPQKSHSISDQHKSSKTKHRSTNNPSIVVRNKGHSRNQSAKISKTNQTSAGTAKGKKVTQSGHRNTKLSDVTSNNYAAKVRHRYSIDSTNSYAARSYSTSIAEPDLDRGNNLSANLSQGDFSKTEKHTNSSRNRVRASYKNAQNVTKSISKKVSKHNKMISKRKKKISKKRTEWICTTIPTDTDFSESVRSEDTIIEKTVKRSKTDIARKQKLTKFETASNSVCVKRRFSKPNQDEAVNLENLTDTLFSNDNSTDSSDSDIFIRPQIGKRRRLTEYDTQPEVASFNLPRAETESGNCNLSDEELFKENETADTGCEPMSTEARLSPTVYNTLPKVDAEPLQPVPVLNSITVPSVNLRQVKAAVMIPEPISHPKESDVLDQYAVSNVQQSETMALDAINENISKSQQLLVSSNDTSVVLENQTMIVAPPALMESVAGDNQPHIMAPSAIIEDVVDVQHSQSLTCTTVSDISPNEIVSQSSSSVPQLATLQFLRSSSEPLSTDSVNRPNKSSFKAKNTSKKKRTSKTVRASDIPLANLSIRKQTSSTTRPDMIMPDKVVRQFVDMVRATKQKEIDDELDRREKEEQELDQSEKDKQMDVFLANLELSRTLKNSLETPHTSTQQDTHLDATLTLPHEMEPPSTQNTFMPIRYPHSPLSEASNDDDECTSPTLLCDQCKLAIPRGTMHTIIDGKKWCSFCSRSKTIQENRKAAFSGITTAADKMLQASKGKFPVATIGQNVLVPTPEPDRGPLDDANLLGKILNVHNETYLIGTAKGILKNYLPRNAFTLTDVSMDSYIPKFHFTLRELAAKHSTQRIPGLHKCSCGGKCVTKRCICRRNNVLCGSSCHSSSSCTNK